MPKQIRQTVLPHNIWQVLYLGILSSGITYTLQMVSLKGTNMTIVSILLSMESVFSVIAGALILGERLTGRDYLGCALMLCAVLLSQIPGKGFGRRAEESKIQA